MFNKNTLSTTERKLRVMGGVLVSTGALALSGCGSSEDRPVATSTKADQAPTKTEAQTSAVSESDKKKAKLVFDDLGGSESVIQVYKGVGDSVSDKKHTGTFYSGDTAVAQCKAEGRTVHSDPTTGESESTSNDWIRVEKSPDPSDTAYATAVYVEQAQELLQDLPVCK